ncbi:hypothetical protein [Larkinella soli]|uniref:hypothetical protein n=1 Tax=Larkinella soli TaxID=1770527 RepID=UPI000FFC6C1A|nr:hypothetical protein [Larkinella soli]
MNQTFSFRRFGLLFRLYLSEHLRTYLMGLGVLTGVWLFMLSQMLNLERFYPSIYAGHTQSLILVFSAASTWYTSELFKVVQNPVRGIPYLALPASMFEKYLVPLTMMFLFIPVFLADFYLIEGFYVSIVNGKLPAGSQKYTVLDFNHPEVRWFHIPMFIALLAQSFFFVGSIYFPKVPFVKTGIAALLLFLVGYYFNRALLSWQLPSTAVMRNPFPFLGFSFQTPDEKGYYLELTDTGKEAVRIFWYLMFPALWFITYVRFREKQI